MMGYLPNTLCIPIGAYLYFCQLSIIEVMSHGHLLDNVMKTIMIPLVKHKPGDTSNVNNYKFITSVSFFKLN